MSNQVSNGARVRLALVDDHPLFRAGLRELMSRRFTVVFDTGTTSEACELSRALPFDLAIVDIVVPSSHGPQLTRDLKAIRPNCKILGLSFLEEPVRIAEMFRAGVNGCALKTQSLDDLVDAVERVLEGETYLAASLARTEVELLATSPTLIEQLTQRERDVLALLVRGLSNDEVGARLFIAKRTVEAHRLHLMHKLSARSIVDLVRIALRHGMECA